jgi:hypothetical protein
MLCERVEVRDELRLMGMDGAGVLGRVFLVAISRRKLSLLELAVKSGSAGPITVEARL